MRCVIAIDSFKGSLSSIEAGEAVATGVRRAIPSAETCVRPLADGGEGTVDALVRGMGGEFASVEVAGPLGAPVKCGYGIVDGATCVLEMAAAAGLPLVPQSKRNPLVATTYGVGEAIRDALARGCRRFVVGIGGSATNDGGAGMLQALGYRLLDADGNDLPRGGAALARLAKIDVSGVPPELGQSVFKIACDVSNPLCGPNGASAVFGPQKGATPEMVAELDAALAHFAEISGGDATAQGSGAAGGLGFAFKTFLGGELVSGVDLVLSETRLEDYVGKSDVVVTGEGRLDAQTAMGKAPIGVAKLAKRHGKPVLAFAGCVTPDAGVVNAHGIDAFFPCLRTVVTLEEAMDGSAAAANVAATAEQAFRLFAACGGTRGSEREVVA